MSAFQRRLRAACVETAMAVAADPTSSPETRAEAADYLASSPTAEAEQDVTALTTLELEFYLYLTAKLAGEELPFPDLQERFARLERRAKELTP